MYWLRLPKVSLMNLLTEGIIPKRLLVKKVYSAYWYRLSSSSYSSPLSTEAMEEEDAEEDMEGVDGIGAQQSGAVAMEAAEVRGAAVVAASEEVEASGDLVAEALAAAVPQEAGNKPKKFNVLNTGM